MVGWCTRSGALPRESTPRRRNCKEALTRLAEDACRFPSCCWGRQITGCLCWKHSGGCCSYHVTMATQFPNIVSRLRKPSPRHTIPVDPGGPRWSQKRTFLPKFSPPSTAGIHSILYIISGMGGMEEKERAAPGWGLPASPPRPGNQQAPSTLPAPLKLSHPTPDTNKVE